MNNKLAIFVTYAAMLVDGNLITNKLSIGGKTLKTGPDSPGVLAGGLNTPGLGIEGTLNRTWEQKARINEVQ